ncbi:MAG: hypothetical protein L6R40_001078 [Gallowayella cf. fulva]|nr:MAG: hypothetical protein L6R40_001078 [Xanthomendoza cf. fulva]
MLVKLPSFVLVALATSVCFAAPTSEPNGLSARESSTGRFIAIIDLPSMLLSILWGSKASSCRWIITSRRPTQADCDVEARKPNHRHYPDCGAPVCRRDAVTSHLPLDNNDAELLKRGAELCRCPVGQVAFIFHGHCQCSGDPLVNYTRTDISERDTDAVLRKPKLERKRDNSVQGGITNCHKIGCPPGAHGERVYGRCLCVPNNKRRALSVLTEVEERDAQYDAGPLDCASIAKCPTNQHPVNNAADGMCECVDDDQPDTGILDCVAIAKCPADQHAVFNNSAGRCECIPDGTQLDCPSISKCSDGAHPINYNGNCICVPDMMSTKEKR